MLVSVVSLFCGGAWVACCQGALGSVVKSSRAKRKLKVSKTEEDLNAFWHVVVGLGKSDRKSTLAARRNLEFQQSQLHN